jgi:ankyrin repeat-rich membrane spanning protein
VLLSDGYGTDINKTDKFGCNALFWACRKGEAAVVKRLLKAGIDINAIGAHGQSALIVATRNMHEEVVEMLLTANLGGSDPVNVSHVDSDNNTALNFAADKGLTASVRMLLEAGASKNHQNKKKQTPLILAVKKGHQEIVRLLLNHDVNVNLLDKENRSALYLAVKEATMGGKNPFKEIIKMLVKRKDIYLEAFTKINDNKKIISETALLKAVRNRNASIVNILLKSGATVDVRDQDWNNPLHLSIRFRDKTITEMLLRNPKNSNLVYKKNKENETPHEIDLENPVSILTKIWGEKIVTSSTKGLADDMSQYELYTNSLADILAEPELKLPITVGIFAKWGSGKDFLLLSLSKVMGSFVGDEGDVHYSPPFSVHLTFLFIVGWICTLIAGIAFSRTDTSNIAIILPCVAGAILLLYGTIMALATHGNRKYIENDRKKKWRFCNSLAKALTRFGTRLKLIFVMLFKTGVPNPDSSKTKPVKFLFANQARLNIGASENSLAEVIGALSKTAEEAYGFLPVRIYRAMKPRKESVETRSFCCLPLQSIFMLFWLDIFALTSCLAFGEDNFPTPAHFQTAAILTGVIGGVLITILIAHYWQIIKHMIESPYSRVLKEANKIKEGEKSGREQLKREVDYLAGMVKAFDQYGSHQTRMVIVVNGLDSYKQDDVLKILELVNSLFTQSPYIVIFAVDDNLIRKAVDKDRKDTWEISGRDYLQNMIHLPFYMHQQSNDLTLRRRKILPSDSDSHFDMISLRPFDDRQSVVGSSKSIYGPQESRDSLFSPQDDQGLIRRR